jgi:hypothetical protein
LRPRRPVDELRPRVGLERVLRELAQRGASQHQVDRLLRHRVGVRPAGRRAREHEPVHPLGMRQRELLRDDPA